MHGGVYVPVTDKTRPNPYLGHLPERDITTPSGRALTLMNPAYMMRQVHELDKELYERRGHITSLKPIRPENAPDDWERHALEAFERGVPKVSSVVPLEGQPHLRLMRPLKTEASCLQCHAAQGYKEGDIRGGISVAVPMKDYEAVVQPHQREELFAHGGLWAVGLVAFGVGARQIHRRRRERDQAQAIVRESEERLAQAQTVAHLGSWHLDVPNNVLEWSKETSRIFGVPEAPRLTYEMFLSCVHPEDREYVDHSWKAALTGAPYDIEHRILANGEVRWVHEQAHLEFDARGNCRIAVGTVHDITERKRAGEALRRGEERFRSLVTATAQMVWTTDAEGNVTDDVPAWRAYTGQSYEQVKGAGWADALHPEDRQRTLATWSRALQTRSPYDTEYRVRHADGAYRHFAARGVPVLEPDGRIREWVGTCTDITERKRAEEDLARHREHLEQLVGERTQELEGARAAALSLMQDADQQRQHAEQTAKQLAASEKIVRQRAEWAQGLQKAGEELSACNTIEDVARVAAQAPVEHLSARMAWVNALRDGRMTPLACSSPDIQHDAETCECPQAVYASGHERVVPDTTANPPYDTCRLAAETGGFRSCGTWPIRVGGQCVATLTIRCPETGPDSRVAAAAALLEVFCRQVGYVWERLKTGEVVRQALATLDATADGAFIFDPETLRFSYVNEGAVRQVGYSREELLRMTPLDIKPEFDEARFREMIAPLLRGERSFANFTTVHRRKDGSDVPVETNLQYVAPVGERARFIAIVRDITERKRSEGELRKLWRALEHASVSVAITNVKGTIEYVNPTFAAVTGYSREEAIGQNPRILQSGKHPPEFYMNLWATILSGQVWRGEFCNRKKSGELYWESAAIAPVRSEQGALTHFVGIKEDITGQKRIAEELRRAKEAAEAANQAKSAFLANISHEIRTPLNAVLGFSQLMQRDAALTAQQRDHLQTIQRSGDHLLGLINDILEMSKIEAGRVELNVTTFDLPALLDDIEIMFRGRMTAKGLYFEVNRMGRLPRFVKTDARKLRQILINLLGNAVKFTAKGGVTARIRSESDEQRQARLFVEVEDTGAGIAEPEMQKLFRSFEQTASGLKQMEGSTGLGLAISKEYVRLMGGDISASSVVGKGSVFRFHIRMEEGEAPLMKTGIRRRATVALQPRQPACRILVVDDAEHNRRFLSELLSSVGFEVREAANGLEAVQVFEQWRPRLILMDMRMPVLDGYEASRRIRRSSGGKETKIVAVTASVVEESRQKMFAAGVDDYLAKPVVAEDLFEKIRQHLGVEYRYEAKIAGAAPAEAGIAARLTREALVGLPPNLVAQMREATINADLFRLEELIEQVATLDPQLAEGLKTLAGEFDYEQLAELLQTDRNT
jgi:PAS domain S-box-containing protein